MKLTNQLPIYGPPADNRNEPPVKPRVEPDGRLKCPTCSGILNKHTPPRCPECLQPLEVTR